MTLTNKFNLPKALVNAINNDPYGGDFEPGDGFSVTKLIAPPYQRMLMGKHKDEITEDAIDRLWAFYGQTVHDVAHRGCSKADGDLAEVRLFGECAGYKLHGKFDLLEKGNADLPDNTFESLIDFKFTSVYSAKDAMANGKPEWTAQINMLHWLARYNGKTVRTGKIVVLCKDWRPSEAKRDPDYPPRVVQIPVKIWTQEEQARYIIERCKLHSMSEPPVCTLEERWYRPGKVAVMKAGRKSALRLLDSVDEADKWCMTNGYHMNVGGISLVVRPGAYPRCSDYCSASEFCPEWATRKQELESDDE